MAIQFTRNGRKAMLWAQVEAMRRGDLYVEPEHLLLGLLHGETTGALRLLDRLALSGGQVKDAVSAMMPPEAAGARVETSQLSPGAKKIVEQARRETEATGDDYVGTEHLMLAVLRGLESGTATRIDLTPVLSRFNLTHARAAEAVKNVTPESPMNVDEEPLPPPIPPIIPRPGFLKGRDLLSITDLTPQEVRGLFELTREIKSGRAFHEVARHKTLALLFEKPSLRTRATFGVAMTRLGGENMYLSPQEVGMGTRETVSDVAKGLSRWMDAVAIRTFEDSRLREFAEAADIPVINALTDREHPCQALADFYTILESRSSTAGMKMVFIGDGNNVAHSLMLLAPCLGTHFTLCCPQGYEPDSEILAQAKTLARQYNTNFEISYDPITASDDADVLYTDVWTSMGQEAESAKRLNDFAGFELGPELIREAKDDVLVLHCLPAHRGEEIAAEVIDGPHSGVWDQAENRLHIQQALLAAVL